MQKFPEAQGFIWERCIKPLGNNNAALVPFSYHGYASLMSSFLLSVLASFSKMENKENTEKKSKKKRRMLFYPKIMESTSMKVVTRDLSATHKGIFK